MLNSCLQNRFSNNGQNRYVPTDGGGSFALAHIDSLEHVRERESETIEILSAKKKTKNEKTK